MEIQLSSALLRPWRAADARALAKNADNPKIAANLTDGFPNPYRLEDAVRFIEGAPSSYFCIEVDGEASGGIGYAPGGDIHRFGAELGYWVAEQHWHRGITTEAVTAMRRYVLGETEIRRLFALPYASNPASHRVLEKCGFVFEGRMRNAAFKSGSFVDQLIYAAVEPEGESPPHHALTILAVSDLDRAVTFYRQALLWTPQVETPVYVELAHPDGTRLGLYRRDGFSRNTLKEVADVPAGVTSGTELYFYAPDISEAIGRLRAAGAELLSPRALRPWGDEAAYFSDPFGNVVVVAIKER